MDQQRENEIKKILKGNRKRHELILKYNSVNQKGSWVHGQNEKNWFNLNNLKYYRYWCNKKII